MRVGETKRAQLPRCPAPALAVALWRWWARSSGTPVALTDSKPASPRRPAPNTFVAEGRLGSRAHTGLSAFILVDTVPLCRGPLVPATPGSITSCCKSQQWAGGSPLGGRLFHSRFHLKMIQFGEILCSAFPALKSIVRLRIYKQWGEGYKHLSRSSAYYTVQISPSPQSHSKHYF